MMAQKSLLLLSRSLNGREFQQNILTSYDTKEKAIVVNEEKARNE